METIPVPVEVLAIGAHPDDIEIGCSGTLAKLVSLGHSVGAADLTGGEMGTRGDRDIRRREALAAAQIMGLSFRTCLNMPDTRVTPSPENEKTIVDLIRTVRPRILFAPMTGETHPDHTAAAELALSAWHKAGFGKYDSPLPPFRPERVVHYMLGAQFTPSFVVDITEFIEKRRQALKAHASQFFNERAAEFTGNTRLASPDFWEALETRVRWFGNRILKRFGEPFYIREVPEIGDPAGLSDAFSVFREKP